MGEVLEMIFKHLSMAQHGTLTWATSTSANWETRRFGLIGLCMKTL